MRILVTGADGFVGRWLVQHLVQEGDDVWQACGLNPGPGAQCVRLDVTDIAAVTEIVTRANPDAIYHLAAIAFGPEVTAHMQAAARVNVLGTVNVLEAARSRSAPPIVLIPSSSEVYGQPDDEPIDETARLEPTNLYGATKAAQETVGLAYHRAGLVPVALARAFNQIGPGQSEAFVVPAFAGQLAEIVLGRTDAVLRVGNLDVERDFTDVRDAVRAYRLMVAGRYVGSPYNVASGRAVAVKALLELLIGLSGARVRVEVDAAKLRGTERPRVVGSSALLRNVTGWSPEFGLDETLRDVWEDALQRHGARD